MHFFSVVIQWILTAAMIFLGLVFLPSFSSILFVLAAILAAPIRSLRDAMHHIGAKGWMIGVVAALLFIGGFFSAPSSPAEAEPDQRMEAPTAAATDESTESTTMATTTTTTAATTTAATTTATTAATTSTTTTSTTAATTAATTSTTTTSTTATTTAARPPVMDGAVLTVYANSPGAVVDGDTIYKVPVYTSLDIGYSQVAGPMILTIDSIQVSTCAVKDKASAALLDVDVGQEFTLVALRFCVENTSREDVSFYPDQSVIVTSAHEQIDSNIWISDDVGGDYLGQVVKEGIVYYVCQRTAAEELAGFVLRINGPFDADYARLADDIKIEINLEE